MSKLDKSENYKKHIGEVYGSLTVTGVLPSEEWPRFCSSKRPVVTADCDCGGQWVGKLNALRSGNSRSCGCAHFYTALAEAVGVPRSLIKDRLLRGWSVEAAVETPKKR